MVKQNNTNTPSRENHTNYPNGCGTATADHLPPHLPGLSSRMPNFSILDLNVDFYENPFQCKQDANW